MRIQNIQDIEKNQIIINQQAKHKNINEKSGSDNSLQDKIKINQENNSLDNKIIKTHSENSVKHTNSKNLKKLIKWKAKSILKEVISNLAKHGLKGLSLNDSIVKYGSKGAGIILSSVIDYKLRTKEGKEPIQALKETLITTTASTLATLAFTASLPATFSPLATAISSIAVGTLTGFFTDKLLEKL